MSSQIATELGGESTPGPPVALIDLLDRLLTGGAVLTGDLVLSIADVDLVHINLRAVIRSITADEPAPLCIPVRTQPEEL